MRHITLTLAILFALSISAIRATAQEAAPSPIPDDFVQAVADSADRARNTISQEQDALMAYLHAEQMTPQRRAEAEQQAEAIRQHAHDLHRYLREAVESHADSPATSQLLLRFKQLLGLDFLAQFMATYPHADLPELAGLREELAIEAKKQPGAELIDFELPDEVGAMHRLSEYIGHGHYVLVDFWASWCGPCRQEMPHVVAAYERFHERGFDILGLSLDNNREAWLRAVAELGMSWPQLSDLRGWQSLAAQTYHVHAIPFTLLFDPEGKVVASNLRGDALTEKLLELIGE